MQEEKLGLRELSTMKVAITALLLLGLFAGIVACAGWYHERTRLVRNMQKYRTITFFGCEGDCRNMPDCPNQSDVSTYTCVQGAYRARRCILRDR